MNKKIIFVLVFLVFIIAIASVIFLYIGNPPEETPFYGTIYIRNDGNVDPSSVPLQHVGNIYTFTDDIFGEIVVERDSIIIDGNGFQLQGSGTGIGLDLRVSNVTVRDTNVQNYLEGIIAGANNTISENTITNNSYGIYGVGDDCIISGNRIAKNGYGITTSGAKHNIISGNTITNNEYGFFGTINYMTISGNNITSNKFYGLFLTYSTYNNISGNTITHNRKTITEDAPLARALYFVHSRDNNIFENNIAGNDRGIDFFFDTTPSSNNTIYLNNFVNNDVQVLIGNVSVNVWDNGVKGNYWNDYNGTDNNGDGIGDTPYAIDANNQDRYPLTNPYSIP